MTHLPGRDLAGQGVDVLDELATLVAQRPELLSGAELASDVLGEVAASDLGLASSRCAWAQHLRLEQLSTLRQRIQFGVGHRGPAGHGFG